MVVDLDYQVKVYMFSDGMNIFMFLILLFKLLFVFAIGAASANYSYNVHATDVSFFKSVI